MEMSQPGIIEYVVIVAYFVMLIAVGLVMRKLNTNESDYFRNGCKGTWWLVGSSAFMVSFSAWTFTGAAGVAFESGWSILLIYFANALGFFMNFLFLAPWFRQLRATTAPEMIGLRFGTGTKQFYAWFAVISRLFYSALHLYGLAIFSSSVFGLPINTVIVVIGCVVLFYSLIGGSWAVMATDFLQSLILIPITVLICILCLKQIGGFGELIGAIDSQQLSSDFSMVNKPGHFPANKFTIVWAVALFLKNMISHNTLRSGPRYFAVKDGRAARKAALLACVLTLGGAVIWAVPPITARLLMGDQVAALDVAKPAEAAYAMISLALLPKGLVGLIVVAIFAATMSSMDTGLNKNAAIVTKDLYPGFCRMFGREPGGQKTRLRVAQGLTGFFGAGTIWLALYYAQQGGKGIFELMLSIGTLLGLPLTIPMLLCLFVRRTPSWAAVATVLATFIPSVLGYHSEGLFGAKWSFQQQVFINLAVGSLTFMATRFFWKGASEEYQSRLDTFFTNMHTPVNFKEEIDSSNDDVQLRLLGQFGVAAAAFIALLVFVPNPVGGRIAILSVAGFIGLASGAMLWVGRRTKSASAEGGE